MVRKIISGGQTGADRAALDFAIKHNLPHRVDRKPSHNEIPYSCFVQGFKEFVMEHAYNSFTHGLFMQVRTSGVSSCLITSSPPPQPPARGASYKLRVTKVTSYGLQE